ncbi:MAG: Gfo/Idh/MocA family oxidoreductase [Anaerolineae bacterium]|nr:Gfo/Idh/MocA family oxidoreductase [Anaerolineae bacterium]
MADTLCVGLIGCGNVVSYGHKPALTTLTDVELVALADITPERRKIGQEWFTLRDDQLYTDYKDILAIEAIEAVAITVPQQFRRQIVLDALAAGKHVLSEKPIADTPLIAAELIKAADDAGLLISMVHNYHFLPEYRMIKHLIDSGTIGDMRVLNMNFLGVIDYPGAAEFKADWRHTMGAGGGVLMDMIHAVYLVEWLAGEQAIQVNAFVDAPTYASRKPVVEDLALLQIAFPSSYALINMAWGQGVGGVDVSGSNGQIRMRYNQNQTSGFNQAIELFSVNDWQRTDHAVPNLMTHMDNIARSFTELWADFRDAIREKRQPIAHATAGHRALEIALAGYISGTIGHTVTLPLSADNPVYQQGIMGMKDIAVWDESRTKQVGLFGLRDEK